MRRYVLSILGVALLALGLIGPTASAVPVASSSSNGMTPAQRLARGPLPKNAAAYARAKAKAQLAAAATTSQRAPRSGINAPAKFIDWEGAKAAQAVNRDLFEEALDRHALPRKRNDQEVRERISSHGIA